jgi:acyl carrier protein
MEAPLENVRALLVENCMLKADPAASGDDTPLFGPGGLGLDSIDALQLAVAIEQHFGTPVKNPKLARQIHRSPGIVIAWVERQKAGA